MLKISITLVTCHPNYEPVTSCLSSKPVILSYNLLIPKESLHSHSNLKMNESPITTNYYGCGDVFGYGSGFVAGAAIGGFITTSLFSSGVVITLITLLAGHIAGSLLVADTVHQRQTREIISRVNKT